VKRERTHALTRQREMFDLDGDRDPRFQTPHYLALLDACDLADERLKLVPKRRAFVAGIAVTLADEFTTEQIAQARTNWTMPTAPTPEQMAEKIGSLLNRRTEIQPYANSNPLPARVANDDAALRSFIASRAKRGR
jgi:hypothetical protein